MANLFIALAIPVFFLLIAIELLVQRRTGRGSYRLNDAVTDLSCGVGQQMFGIFTNAGLLAGYAWLQEGYGAFDLAADEPLTWLVAFLGVDFLYYWWHRLSHEVNFLWAVHVVHHQSQDYNLAVALRQAWFSSATTWLFYWPLAFVGVPPLVFGSVTALSTLYQFWIHTEVVGRLGVLDAFLSTPSLHRVHHGVNPRYIDRNHGATLMIWDRLFGTYQREEEPCVYGTALPYRSWNPIWANFDYWKKLWNEARRTRRRFDKILVWFMRPGWRPRDLGPHEVAPPVDAASFVKFDLPHAQWVRAYAAVQYVPVVAATFLLLLYRDDLSADVAAVSAALVMATLLSLAGLFEGRVWAVPLELARLASGAAAAVVYLGVFSGAPFVAAAGVGWAAVSASWVVRSVRRAPAERGPLLQPPAAPAPAPDASSPPRAAPSEAPAAAGRHR